MLLNVWDDPAGLTYSVTYCLINGRRSAGEERSFMPDDQTIAC